jgi:hypothetical protein
LSKDGSDTKKINVEKSLDRALKYIESIPKMYSEGEIRTRRDIIGSIFPEKLEFDGKTYRTTRMNVIADYIFQINNGLLQKKEQDKRKYISFVLSSSLNKNRIRSIFYYIKPC